MNFLKSLVITMGILMIIGIMFVIYLIFQNASNNINVNITIPQNMHIRNCQVQDKSISCVLETENRDVVGIWLFSQKTGKLEKKINVQKTEVLLK